MLPTLRIFPLLILACTIACGDAIAPRRDEGEDHVASSAFTAIVDAKSGGVPGFYFLQPIRPDPDAAVVFDPSLLAYLAVEICQLVPKDRSTCATPPLIRFTAQAADPEDRLRLVEGELYVARWKSPRKVNTRYRISVWLAGFELGHADARIVSLEESGGHDGQSIAVVAGRTLPIRFQVSQGIRNAGTISRDGGLVIHPETGARLVFPAGAISGAVSASIERELPNMPIHTPLSRDGFRIVIRGMALPVGWRTGDSVTLSLPTTRSPVPSADAYIRAGFDALPGMDFWAIASPGTPAPSLQIKVPADGIGELLTVLQIDSLGFTVQGEEFTPDPVPPPIADAIISTSPMPGFVHASSSIVGCDDYPLDLAPGSREPQQGDVGIVVIHGWLPGVPSCAAFIASQILPSTITGAAYFARLLGPMTEEFQSEMPILIFTYPTHRHFGYSASWLASRLVQAKAQYNLTGFVLVGHSMGGLVARSAVEGNASLPAIVRGIVTLGTPHLGTPYPNLDAARSTQFKRKATAIALRIFATNVKTAGGQSLVSPGLSVTGPGMPLVAYAGDLNGRPSATVGRLTHVLFQLLCTTFGECENDSVVPEESATPAVATKTMSFQYTHTELHEGANSQASPTDPLYLELWQDIRQLAGQIGGARVVAHYPLDGNALDVAGNGYHGTVNGALAGADRFGTAGKALTFNGTTNYVVLQDSPTNSRSEGTISLWLKIGGPTTPQACGRTDLGNFNPFYCHYNIFGKSTVGGGGLRAQLGTFDGVQNPWDTFYFQVNGERASTSDPRLPFGDPGTVPQGAYSFTTWHMYTLVWDATSKRIYLDGVKLAEFQGAFMTPTTGALHLGDNADPNVHYERLKGAMDDVRIYDRALTQPEIQNLLLQR